MICWKCDNDGSPIYELNDAGQSEARCPSNACRAPFEEPKAEPPVRLVPPATVPAAPPPDPLDAMVAGEQLADFKLDTALLESLPLVPSQSPKASKLVEMAAARLAHIDELLRQYDDLKAERLELIRIIGDTK